MNVHKLYLCAFAGLCVIAVLASAAWRDHVRDDARRDAIVETQKTDIAGLQQSIASARNQAQAQVQEWERKRRELGSSPSRAPEIIRELVPMQTPIQQTAPLPSQSPPDAPSESLSKQQEIDLAQYAVGCKECSIERDELQQQAKDQQEIIARQNVELGAAKKAAKGGSVWQRTVRVLKWGAIFGAAGYVVGRAQR